MVECQITKQYTSPGRCSAKLTHDPCPGVERAASSRSRRIARQWEQSQSLRFRMSRQTNSETTRDARLRVLIRTLRLRGPKPCPGRKIAVATGQPPTPSSTCTLSASHTFAPLKSHPLRCADFANAWARRASCCRSPPRPQCCRSQHNENYESTPWQPP